MREISAKREQIGLTVLKYYGHWPYYRICGVQEPASAFFSFGNVLPHLYHLSLNRRKFLNPNYYMGPWIIVYGLVASFAWSCSAIFHSRKIGLTIDLDYMSALLFLSFGLCVTCRRVFNPFFNKNIWFLHTFALFMSVIIMLRLRDMASGDVTFDEHMSLSIGIAALQCVLWSCWCIFTSYSGPNWKLCLLLQLWFATASSLEIFDFPPFLRHFDAHALWHAATIPLGYLWYIFWIRDAEFVIALQSVPIDVKSKDTRIGGSVEGMSTT
jgi:post-GPI attachment to proteins factor 3